MRITLLDKFAGMILSVAATTVVNAQTITPFFPPAGTNPLPQLARAGALASPWPWMEAWSGAGVTNHFYGAWVGGVIALNESRNVWADGLVVRLEGVIGHYNYTTTALPNGRSNVPMQAGALMVGYRKVLGSTTLTGYVGAAIEHAQNKDTTAKVRGTDIGLRVLVEMYSRLSSFQDVYAQASYSTAFSKWNVLLRPGFQIRRNVWVGPEGQLFGSRGSIGSSRYTEGRVGGFVQFQFEGQTLSNIIFSGGHTANLSKAGQNGHQGYYVQVGTSYRF